jgi:hypothetical protein
VSKSTGSISTSGYRTIGREYEHRIVLRAVIGGDPHPCHWCNRMLAWGVDLHVDHVDHDKLNNDPRNLVPSCQPCNNSRSRKRLLTHCGRGHEFTPENSGWNVANRSRFCRTCQRAYLRRSYQRRIASRPALPIPPAITMPLFTSEQMDGLVSATEASRMLVAVSAGLIMAWRQLGRITPQGRRGQSPLYRLGDIVAVEEAMAAKALAGNNHRSRRAAASVTPSE